MNSAIGRPLLGWVSGGTVQDEIAIFCVFMIDTLYGTGASSFGVAVCGPIQDTIAVFYVYKIDTP